MTDHPRPSDALGAPEPLRSFNRAGVLATIDVHAATTVARLLGENDLTAVLGAALAVRATRLGHVRFETAAGPAAVAGEELDPEEVFDLAWPTADEWVWMLTTSPLTSGPSSPLVADGSALYLRRFWEYERRVAERLAERASAPALPVAATASAILDTLIRSDPGDEIDFQRLAVAMCLTRPLAVVAGGPGTGKTWTVARFLATLAHQARAAGEAPPSLAIAAPTGKAAQRATESLRQATSDFADNEILDPAVIDDLAALEASTIHRLLGWRPERGRFRHDAENPLPHDFVVVDEMSMVGLSMMDDLLSALRPAARLVLVGDPDQLVSIEAGSVLGDIVGPARDGFLHLSGGFRAEHESLTRPLPGGRVTADGLVDTITVLKVPHRFDQDSPVGAVARAISSGSHEDVVSALTSSTTVRWLNEATDPLELPDIIAAALARHAGITEAAADGDAITALVGLASFAVLCANRRGPRGVEAWTRRLEEWHKELRNDWTLPMWYAGRPVMVTRNDYQMNIFNGDIGITVDTPDGLRVAFPDAEGPRLVLPSRLGDVMSVYAMTIHKSQGSEFEDVTVILPRPESPLATRELIYTAATRASKTLTLVGEQAALFAALDRRVQRASGLEQRLWG